jgi:hypothetical protein
MSESRVVGTFLPTRCGLHFANRFPSGPTLRLGPLDPRWIGIGDAANGLCGGMSWFVRERFAADQPIPTDTQPPANGSPLFKTLVRRQVQSLELMRTPFAFWRMGGFGSDRIAQRSRDGQWPRVRATIDAGRLAMVGLVRSKGLNPFKLTQNHQAVCYGYDVTGDEIRLRLYDPNWPDRDDVTVTIARDRLTQSTGEPLFGVIALD